jgi:hypothetical protein
MRRFPSAEIEIRRRSLNPEPSVHPMLAIDMERIVCSKTILWDSGLLDYAVSPRKSCDVQDSTLSSYKPLRQ